MGTVFCLCHFVRLPTLCRFSAQAYVGHVLIEPLTPFLHLLDLRKADLDHMYRLAQVFAAWRKLQLDLWDE